MLTKSEKKELDRRIKRHKDGESKSFTISEVKKHAISKKKSILKSLATKTPKHKTPPSV